MAVLGVGRWLDWQWMANMPLCMAFSTLVDRAESEPCLNSCRKVAQSRATIKRRLTLGSCFRGKNSFVTRRFQVALVFLVPVLPPRMASSAIGPAPNRISANAMVARVSGNSNPPLPNMPFFQ